MLANSPAFSLDMVSPTLSAPEQNMMKAASVGMTDSTVSSNTNQVNADRAFNVKQVDSHKPEVLENGQLKSNQVTKDIETVLDKENDAHRHPQAHMI